MSRRFLVNRAVLATCVLALNIPGHASEPLTLDEALRLATVRSRQLDAHSALAQAARERSVAAGQLPDPVIKFGINNLPVTGPDRYRLTRDFMTMRSVAITQELIGGDKRKTRASRFDREAEAVLASRAIALADLQRETATAWLDLLYQQRMTDLLRGLRAETALQIAAADSAYSTGRGSQVDSVVARSAVAQIEERMLQQESMIAATRIRLARWVGPVDKQTILGAAPPLSVTHLEADTIDTHLQRHPRIQWMLRQEAVAQAEVQIAQTARQSDWSVELMFSQRGPAFSNMLSINLAIPMQWDQQSRQDREVAARLAVLEQLRAEREEATREHVAQAHAWLQQWHGDQGRLAHYNNTLIPLAMQRTRASLVAYRAGAGPLIAVLEARRAEIDVQMDRLRLEMESANLWAQLAYLVVPDPPVPARPAVAAESQP